MDEEDDQFRGRKPSYDSKGRVRGYRTRPGAPMHNPTSNNPITSGTGFTPDDIWADKFKPRLGRNAPAPEHDSGWMGTARGCHDFQGHQGSVVHRRWRHESRGGMERATDEQRGARHGGSSLDGWNPAGWHATDSEIAL